jgi:ATP-dependent helicase/nuclease subunit A
METARETAIRIDCDEYRRLLYVAMTRAIERLVVCGVDGEKKRPEGCWYDLVREALRADAIEEPADDGQGTVLRYRKFADDAESRAPAPTEVTPAVSVPAWLSRAVDEEAPRERPITPSGFIDDPELIARGGLGLERQRALARGSLVHRLMQSLPDIAPEHRAEATRRFLARNPNDFSQPELDEIARQVLALFDDARFAPLFAPGSRAEVSISGRLGDRDVAGQVDRIVITPKEVLIADYKTNRPAPRSLEETQSRHAGYVTQLALYRAVLARLYPDRPVRAALLWTDTPELLEVPASVLDSALPPSPPRDMP